MSQVRVHNFSISLDGFGTGEGLTFDDMIKSIRATYDERNNPPSIYAKEPDG